MSTLVLLRCGYKEVLINPHCIESVEKATNHIIITTSSGRKYLVQEVFKGGKYEELSTDHSLSNLINILSCRSQVEEGGTCYVAGFYRGSEDSNEIFE